MSCKLDIFLKLFLADRLRFYFFICLVCDNSRFRHEAERLDQEARGKLERQKLNDEAEAERARKELLELQAVLVFASISDV